LSDNGEKVGVQGQYMRFSGLQEVLDSVRREVLNILFEFSVPVKLIGLKICLRETYIKVLIGKLLSDVHTFHSEWSETRRCFITIAFKLTFRICHLEDPRKQRGLGIECDISDSGLCQ
jgi:hypothetical protein